MVWNCGWKRTKPLRWGSTVVFQGLGKPVGEGNVSKANSAQDQDGAEFLTVKA
jgi:hypothetical protein